MAISQRKLKKALRAMGTDFSAIDEARKEQTKERVLAFMQSHPVERRASAYQRLRLAGKFLMPSGVWNYALQPIMVVVLAFTLVTGGWVTSVSAASNSLPGDALYTVKLVSEKTQLKLAYWSDDPLVVTGLQVSFAKRRIDEIQAVQNSHEVDNKQERIGRAVAGFKKGIAAVKESLQSSSAGQSVKTAAIAKEIKEQGSELVAAIERAEQEVSEDVAAELASAKDVVEDATDQAVEIIVEQQQDGEGLVSQEDIAEAIAAKLQRATEHAQQEQAHEASKVVQKHLGDGEFEEALAEVKKIRALVKEQQTASAQEESAEQEKPDLSDVLVRVIENVTSTIIGE